MTALLAANDDRRRPGRRRTLLTGKVSYGDPPITTSCVVRSLSEDGAMIEIETPTLLPDDLQLLVVSQGVIYDTRLVWAREQRAGLQVKSRHDVNGPLESQLLSLQLLWKQLAPR